jgi:hypothetical protein
MPSVKFKYSDEVYVFPKLIQAINILCVAKGKDCLCSSGYRSIEKQKIINKDVLASHKGAYQTEDGAVYTGTGDNRICWASAYGKSNHNYCIAMDIPDEWFTQLSNTELKSYGLIKPMEHEPWHVQLIIHNGITLKQKQEIRDMVLGVDDMYIQFGDKNDKVKTIQNYLNDLGYDCGNVDGNFGNKTLASVKSLQKKYGLEQTGNVGTDELVKIIIEFKGIAESTENEFKIIENKLNSVKDIVNKV